jgi:hypothetical protein
MLSQYAVEISRDPFARETLVRKTYRSASATCEWCGNRRTVRGKPAALFCYAIERDGCASAWRPTYSRPFCSISCYRAYSN